MNEMQKVLEKWQFDVKAVRERMNGAPIARERERWHAIWLIAQGWSAAQVAAALERDAHTILVLARQPKSVRKWTLFSSAWHNEPQK